MHNNLEKNDMAVMCLVVQFDHWMTIKQQGGTAVWKRNIVFRHVRWITKTEKYLIILQGISESLVGTVTLFSSAHITYLADREKQAPLKDGLERIYESFRKLHSEFWGLSYILYNICF